MFNKEGYVSFTKKRTDYYKARRILVGLWVSTMRTSTKRTSDDTRGTIQLRTEDQINRKREKMQQRHSKRQTLSNFFRIFHSPFLKKGHQRKKKNNS